MGSGEIAAGISIQMWTTDRALCCVANATANKNSTDSFNEPVHISITSCERIGRDVQISQRRIAQ